MNLIDSSAVGGVGAALMTLFRSETIRLPITAVLVTETLLAVSVLITVFSSPCST